MIFVFDENIPKKIVYALTELDKDGCCGHQIHSVYDLGLNGFKDVDLFPKLKEISGDEKCIFISADKRILTRKPEIVSLKSNGLVAFICPPSTCQKDMFERAIYLMNSWRSIVSVSHKSAARAVYKLPAKSFNVTESGFLKV